MTKFDGDYIAFFKSKGLVGKVEVKINSQVNS